MVHDDGSVSLDPFCEDEAALCRHELEQTVVTRVYKCHGALGIRSASASTGDPSTRTTLAAERGRGGVASNSHVARRRRLENRQPCAGIRAARNRLSDSSCYVVRARVLACACASPDREAQWTVPARPRGLNALVCGGCGGRDQRPW